MSDPTVSTPDLYAAAFVLASGYGLLNCSVQDGKVIFAFPPEAANALDDFECGAPIPGRQFAAAHRSVKSMVGRELKRPKGMVMESRG